MNRQLLHRFPNLEMRIPKTVAIGVSEFDRFMARVDLKSLEGLDDPDVRRQIMKAPLSEELLTELREACSTLTGPLAVRSSSLREDAQFQPFAGMYATYMLPNNHPDPSVRFAELCCGRSGRCTPPCSPEKRAPTVRASPTPPKKRRWASSSSSWWASSSATASIRTFRAWRSRSTTIPSGRSEPTKGLCVIALGLGQMVVAGGGGLRFSPAHPGVLPQFSKPEQVLRLSQRKFYALDLASPLVDLTADPSGPFALVRPGSGRNGRNVDSGGQCVLRG